MASRLLGRCARVLCRASSQTPAATAATAVAARLPPAVPSCADLQRAQGWPKVTERSLCERKATVRDHASEDQQKPSQLEELVEKAAQPEDVLLAWAKHSGNSNQAAYTLSRWTQLVHRTNGEMNVLMQDSRLDNVKTTMTEKVSMVWNNNLVSALRSLWIMNVSPEDPVLCSLQTEVLWRARRLTYKQLVNLFVSETRRKDQKDKMLVNILLNQLELRWTEITDTKTVTSLMGHRDRISPALRDRLEDKALELAEAFSTTEIGKICMSLAAQGRRSVPLMRGLSYHLLQKPSSELTTQLILNITYAFGKLNFHHSQLFQQMASEMLPRVPELTPTNVTAYAKSLGFLKWMNNSLFDAFAEHYTANSEDYTILQLCNLLMTFGRIGFQPSSGEFFIKAHSKLEEHLSGLEPFLRTNVVWSLCVLQQAKPHYLFPLLEKQHHIKLSEGSESRGESYRLKLLHIAATLHLEHPGSSDSVAPLPPPVATDPGTISRLQISLREALQSLVGQKGAALFIGVDTVHGWAIDGELTVDCDNKPVEVPHPLSEEENQSLPVGTRRIAFLAMDFSNFGLNRRKPLGRFVMRKRHLKLAGYTIVEVPYFDWLDLKTDWQKRAYLKDRLEKAVAEDMAE